MSTEHFSPGQLSCRLVETLEGWRELEPVWNDLLAASPDSTPWQSYVFLTEWWRHLGLDKKLRIYVVERGGKPVLLLPLQLASWGVIPGLQVRVLEPVSMIMDVNRPRMGLGPFDERAYRCAFEEIWRTRQEWHVLRIDEKPWDDAEVAFLRTFALEHTCIFRHSFSHLVPWLDLRQRWPDFLQTRSQRMRKNIKAARRKLEANGPVRLRRYAPSEIDEGFSVLLDLHSRSWKRQRKVEHSKSTGYQAFYQSWVKHMSAQHCSRVYTLLCGEQPVAATIAFMDRGTYYSAQIVHDARFAHGSPGTLLEAMELEDLMKEQEFRKYDFLGSFINNKMRWTDTATNTSHVLVLRRCVRSFLVDGYYSFLKPYVRPAIMEAWRKLTGQSPRPAH